MPMWRVKTDVPQRKLIDELYITEGSRQDYFLLKHFHYIAEGLPPYLKIYTLRHPDVRSPVGVIVFANPPLNSRVYTALKLNKLFRKKINRVKYINKHFTVIARVIIHPSIRGIGAAKKLVREASILVPRRFIFIQAEMLYYYNFLPPEFKLIFRGYVKQTPNQFYKCDAISGLFSKSSKGYLARTKIYKPFAIYLWDKKKTDHWRHK